MEEYKVINVIVTHPHDSLFKATKNCIAECRIISCSNSLKCDLFKQNTCMLLNFMGNGCPYGKIGRRRGYSKRARKYRSWISEMETKYADSLRKLKSCSNKIALVGDYVYLPYAHMTLNDGIPFLKKAVTLQVVTV